MLEIVDHEKNYLYTFFLILVFSKFAYAQNIVLECTWDAHVKDYTTDNTWKTFDHNQNFKLTERVKN